MAKRLGRSATRDETPRSLQHQAHRRCAGRRADTHCLSRAHRQAIVFRPQRGTRTSPWCYMGGVQLPGLTPAQPRLPVVVQAAHVTQAAFAPQISRQSASFLQSTQTPEAEQ